MGARAAITSAKALWLTPREKDVTGPPAGPHHRRRVLPDGIIQQVIFRLNSFYPPGSLRNIETVLANLAGG